MSTDRLFQPLQVAGQRWRNRIVHLATLTQYGERNRVTGRLVDYHAARAAGGAAASIVEGLAVHPSSVPLRSVVTLFDEANADGLKRLADAGESRDCRMLGQLWHVGRQQLWSPIDSPVGVSDQPDAYSWTVPHVLDAEEIAELVAAFVDSARRLHAAGFSGVELHGAHGYLITQFLSPWSNTRDDAYGGDRDRRLAFVREIAAGIRQVCGAGFAIGLKMPAEEGVPGGIDLAEADAITRALAADGVIDYFAYSQGNFSLSLDDHNPDMHYRPGHFLGLHKRLRAAAGGRPVMAVGRVVDAAHAERVLADGQADLVGLGRALVADAGLPVKAKRGVAARPCVFCNLCWGEIHQGKPLLCFLNPALGTPDEIDERIAPAAAPRRLVVVGAGPAGLETAWRAAARGHRVSLLDAADEPGGALRLDARLPGRAEMGKAVDYLVGQARVHDVELRLGRRADVATITAARPDLVVLATGAGLRRPPTLPDGDPALSWRDALPQLLDDKRRRPGRAVLFDMDHTDPTYAFAALLAERFAAVTILTPRVQIARNVPFTNSLGIYRRLLRAGVEIVTTALPTGHRDGRVTWRNVFTGREASIGDVALFAYATPRRAVDDLAAPLAAAGLKVRLIGDARAPRTLFSAIHEGAKVAAEL